MGGVALIEAINLAVAFYGTNPSTLPHITYQSVPALSGRSSVQVAIGHLNHLAAATLARTAV